MCGTCRTKSGVGSSKQKYVAAGPELGRTLGLERADKNSRGGRARSYCGDASRGRLGDRRVERGSSAIGPAEDNVDRPHAATGPFKRVATTSWFSLNLPAAHG